MATPPYTRERLTALLMVDRYEVFRVPSRPRSDRRGMVASGWLCLARGLPTGTNAALEEALTLGYLDTSRGPGIAVSLTSTGRGALDDWQRSALWDRNAPTV